MTDQVFLIVFATATFLLAGMVKGAIGIGMPTAAIGLLSQVIDPKTAVALVVFPTFISNAWQMFRAGDLVRAFKDYRIFAVSLMVVLWFTTSLTASVSQQGLLLIIGGVVVAFSLISLLFNPPPLPDRWDTVAQVMCGAVAGIIGGLTSVWAAPIVIYLLGRRVSPDEFIRATGLLITLGAIPLVLGFWYHGIFNGSRVTLSVFLVIPALIGFQIGEVLRKRLPVERFQTAVLIVFLLMGLNIIRRALS